MEVWKKMKTHKQTIKGGHKYRNKRTSKINIIQYSLKSPNYIINKNIAKNIIHTNKSSYSKRRKKASKKERKKERKKGTQTHKGYHRCKDEY
jgi:hypothetical protein